MTLKNVNSKNWAVKVAAIVMIGMVFVSFAFGGRVFNWVCLGIPMTYKSSDEHFEEDGFMDYTDYAKYFYSNSTYRFAISPRYHKVTATDVDNIRSYFKNTEGWMKAGDRSRDFDFDYSNISEGDYWRLKTKEGKRNGGVVYTKFSSYDLDFYDTDTGVLYYIHNNGGG